MKKISLYMFSLLMLAGFSACDEDYTDWADPQSNPQEDSKSGITAQVIGVTPEVVMDTYEEDSVEVAKLETLSGADKVVGYKLQLAGNDKTLSIPFAEKDGVLKVDATELELLVDQLYNSRQSVVRDLAVKVDVAVMASDNEAVSISAGDIAMKVTPVTTPAMEDGYYALGDISSWGADGALAFTQDAGDPAIFTLELTNEKEKPNFKIFPKSGVVGDVDWNKALGAMKDGDTSVSGLLDFTDKKGTQAGAIALELQGKVRITINVKDYTYTIKEVSDLPETMFINGSAYSSDWNWGDACQMIPVTQTPGMFWSMQYYNADEQIKFSPVADWAGQDFGFSTDILTPDAIALAGLTDQGGNIKIGISGWYVVAVTVDNIGGKKVEFLKPEVFLLGGLVNNSWNCNAETQFTVPADKTGDFVSPAATADGVARICCIAAGSGNWWKSEFTLDMSGDASIVYRENKPVSDNLGELGYKCPVTAGQKVHVNFTTGKGTVQ